MRRVRLLVLAILAAAMLALSAGAALAEGHHCRHWYPDPYYDGYWLLVECPGEAGTLFEPAPLHLHGTHRTSAPPRDAAPAGASERALLPRRVHLLLRDVDLEGRPILLI